MCSSFFFFFQAEDGIRDLVRSRGLGDVYKRQRNDRILRYPEKNGQECRETERDAADPRNRIRMDLSFAGKIHEAPAPRVQLQRRDERHADEQGGDEAEKDRARHG